MASTGRLDITKFRGHQEPDVGKWIARFKLLCRAASNRSYITMFAPNCDELILDRLISAEVKLEVTPYSASPTQSQIKEHDETWGELEAKLRSWYHREPNMTQLNQDLQTRRQRVDESVESFSEALEVLAGRLGKELNDITGLFLAGLHQDIQIVLSANVFENYKDAYGAAARVQVVVKQQRESATAAAIYSNQSRNFQMHGRKFPTRPMHCRNCGQNNHLARECPSPQKCFLCGKVGHMARSCFSKRRNDDEADGDPKRMKGGVNLVSDSRKSFNIDIRLLFPKHSLNCRALIDTGASVTLISSRLINGDRLLTDTTDILPANITLTTANDSILEVMGKASILTQIGESGFQTEISYILVNDLKHDAILGIDSLRAMGAIIDCAAGTLLLPNHGNGIFLTHELQPQPTAASIRSISQELEDKLFDGLLINDSEPSSSAKDVQYGPNLQDDERKQLRSLVMEFDGLFHPPSSETMISAEPFRIDTGGSNPIACTVRRIPYTDRAIIDKFVDLGLERGWLRSSKSPWASAVFVVRRKLDGKEKVVCDFRPLNHVTVRDASPIPSVQELLDRMAGCTLFSIMDLENAYYQYPVHVDDIQKTAIVTHRGSFEFLGLPLGLRNAPSYFVRNTRGILHNIPETDAYLDDIRTVSRDFKSHIENLRNLFTVLAAHNMRLKGSKCRLGFDEVKYLGQIVGKDGVKPDPAKVSAIADMTPPRSVSQLRRFLGTVQYLHHFIPHLAELTSPLSQLSRKNQKFTWGPAQDDAFEKIKSEIKDASMLALPDISKQFELQTDASNSALGAVLLQRDDDGHPRPLFYASRGLTQAESAYATQELECLSVIWAMDKFRVYLLGKKFTVYTDHQALLNLKKAKPSSRILRWTLFLQDFEFDIRHVKGSQNHIADLLSRANIASVNVENLADTDTWRRLQSNDDFCSYIMGSLKNGANCTEFYTDTNNILWLSRTDGLPRLVVPRTIVTSVLAYCHSIPLSGHPGVRRTQSRIYDLFFWPGWRADATAFVKECAACQLFQHQNRKRKPTESDQRIKGSGQNDMVAMDILGPLPPSSGSFYYILVIRDLFSGFSVTVPTVDQTAQTISDALIHNWISIFGVPNQILSDNGPCFTSALLDDICICLRMLHIHTTPYRPQTNGSVERFNQTLKAMLSKHVNSSGSNWAKFLPLVTLAYNSTNRHIGGLSPYSIMFLRRPSSITDIFKTTPSASSKGDETQDLLRKNMSDIIHHVIRNHEPRETPEPDTLKKSAISAGDRVLFLVSKPMMGKFARKWSGPAVVQEQTGPYSFVLRGHNGKLWRAHSDFLRKINPRAAQNILNYQSDIMQSDPVISTEKFPRKISQRTTRQHASTSNFPLVADEHINYQIPSTSNPVQFDSFRPQRIRSAPKAHDDFVTDY